MFYVYLVGKGSGGLGALSSERFSEQELLQVEMIKSGRQTIFEEVITRINETEKEVFEEKQQGEYTRDSMVPKHVRAVTSLACLFLE